VIVWTGATPTMLALRIPSDGLVLGRDLLGATTDDRISRQHARVAWRDRRFVVTDLGSRNGTYVGGQPLLDREIAVAPPVVLRAGRTVAVLIDDVQPFEGRTVSSTQEAIVGPSMSPTWQAVEAAALAADHLVLLGEPGSGRGRLARGYARTRNRPDTAFNPTIHAVPLDRVVGPRIETLVLEEPTRLGASNITALGRMLDARAELRVVTTAVAVVELVAALGPELATRLARRTIEVPPLRARPDEMAFLAYDAVRGAEPALHIHSTLIESCLLRPWPGNARELLAEVARCAHTVAAQGKNNIRGEDLDHNAGHLMVGAPTVNAAAQPTVLGRQLTRRGSQSDA
jgi:hypothetical protein